MKRIEFDNRKSVKKVMDNFITGDWYEDCTDLIIVGSTKDGEIFSAYSKMDETMCLGLLEMAKQDRYLQGRGLIE